MTVVVTGATGHLGANLVRELLADGEQVRVLVNRSRRGLDGLDVEVVQGNVGDPDSIARAFDGARVIFHCAAMISIDGDRDGRVWKTNVDGARTVADAARRASVERLVHFSSSHAYDHTRAGEIDEARPRIDPDDAGAHAYDRSKAAGEREVHRQIEQGLNAVILNPSGIVGPNDFGPSRLGRAITLMARGYLPALTPGGYDWVDVRDVARSAITAAKCGRSGESYLLTGHFATLREIADRIASITGKRSPLLTVPLMLAKAVAPFGAALARKLDFEPLFTDETLDIVNADVRFNHALATRDLDHRPRDFGVTLADTLRWFHDSGRLR